MPDKLTQKQSMLTKLCNQWMQLQTDYSYDTDFYDYCQNKIDKINDDCDHIRRTLERR